MTIASDCHACGAEDTYNRFYWHNKALIKDTYQCGRCQHIFRNYFGDVEDYHREKYRVAGEEGHAMYSEEERLGYIGTIINTVQSFLDEGMTALEIGSGDGLFATQIKEHVKEITCSDIDSKMHQKCKDLGLKSLNDSVLGLEDSVQYDVVFGFDVLEHVLDIQQFRDKMTKIVNKFLILQVPVDRTMVPPNNRFDGHSHYFSPKSICTLFDGAFTPKAVHYGQRGKLARGPELLCIFEKSSEQ